MPSSKEHDKSDPEVIPNPLSCSCPTSNQALNLIYPLSLHICLFCLLPQAPDVAHLDCDGNLLTGPPTLLLSFSNTSSTWKLKWSFWVNSVHVILLFKTTPIPYLWGKSKLVIMSCKSLYDGTPGLLSSLLHLCQFPEIRPYRTTRYMSISLKGLHDFILPCLCSYLGFFLVHPNAPHSLGELFILQIYLKGHPSEKPLVTHSTGVDHSLFCEAIVLDTCSLTALSILKGDDLFPAPSLLLWKSRGQEV